MPPTTLIHDAKQFAAAITAAGGAVPDTLANLLSSYELLSSPAATQRPEDAIMDAALDGSLTAAKLDKLLPVAATAHMANTYRQELARSAEHTLVGQFHRAVKAGGADAILDSLRPNFDRHAEAIAKARSLFNHESSPEHILASGESGTIEAWQQLDGHLRVVSKIGAIAAAFGPRVGSFPQIREYALGEGFRIDDRAVMCTDGLLVADSALFQRPDNGHRTSPWARTTLRLHSITEAQARYDQWAADEFDRVHSGPQQSWIDEHGQMHEMQRPENPFRAEVSAS
jgi:hypothetical protein